MRTGTHNTLQEIGAERERQIDREGWSASHDDQHDDFQLARAAACYALVPWRRTEPVFLKSSECPLGWPWAQEWWKPTNDRRDLIKAAALIVAEIERLDRAEGRAMVAEARG